MSAAHSTPRPCTTDWSAYPLGLLPDRVFAAAAGVDVRTVCAARCRARLPAHREVLHAARAVAETGKGLEWMRGVVASVAAWGGLSVPTIPRGGRRAGEALWTAYVGLRSVLADRYRVKVAQVAPLRGEKAPPHARGLDWMDYPLGLLPEPVLAVAAGRSTRAAYNAVRQQGVSWHQTRVRAWLAATYRRPADVAWLRARVRNLQQWACEHYPDSPPTPLDVGSANITSQAVGHDPVALAHQLEALAAHCRRAVEEDQ